MQEIKKIALIGAGAVGSYFIWGLMESKVPDLEFGLLAEGERAARLRKEGVCINGKSYFPQVYERGEWTPDLIIVSVKYQALAEAIEQMVPYGKANPNLIVMSVMNGVDSEERIGQVIGQEHLIDSYIKIASERKADGVFFDPERTMGFFIGERKSAQSAGQGKEMPPLIPRESEDTQSILEQSERIAAIQKLFDQTSLRCRAIDHIEQFIWRKFALNISYNIPQAILDVGMGAYFDSEQVKELGLMLRREVVAVARAQGIPVSEELEYGNRREAVDPQAAFSTLQDLRAKRRTEVDMFCGALGELGQRYQVATPCNAMALALIHAIEEKNEGKIR